MNPLILKTDLVAAGIEVEDDLRDDLRIPDGNDIALDLGLPNGVVASVPVVREGDESPGYRLRTTDGRAYLEHRGGAVDENDRVEVVVHPAPRFYAARTTRGTPLHRLVERRGRVLVVTPLGRCGYSITGRPCTFCIEGGRSTTAAGGPVTPADVVEAVGSAMREAPIDVVLFNSDSAEGDDGGVAFLTPFIQAVRRHAHVLVAAHLHPPRTTAWVDRTYALGVDAVTYGLELFDPDAFGRLCVGRARYIGRDRYLEMLGRAATVFPRGTVWSELVVGVEPVAGTLAGIDALAAMGVVPVLAIPRGPNALGHLPAAADVAALIERLAQAAAEYHLPTAWIRDLGASITPADAQRLAMGTAGTTPHLAVALATRGARLLSRVRRRLRVRLADPRAPGH